MRKRNAEGWGNLFTEPQVLGYEPSAVEDRQAEQARETNRRRIDAFEARMDDPQVARRQLATDDAKAFRDSRSEKTYKYEDASGNILNDYLKDFVKSEARYLPSNPLVVAQSGSWDKLPAFSLEKALESGSSLIPLAELSQKSEEILRGEEFARRAKGGILTEYEDFEKPREAYKKKFKPAPHPELTWTQRMWPVMAQQAAARRAPPPYIAPVSPPSTITSRTPRPFNIAQHQAQQQAHQSRITGGHAGFSGGSMDEKMYSSLGKALLAMEQDYDAVSNITRRAPNRAFIQEAYREGSDYIVDETQVAYYPDETKLKITQIIDGDHNASNIPTDPNAVDPATKILTAANEVQKYAVDAYDSLAPVGVSLTEKFNALDNTSKAMVIGGSVLAAKYLAPGIVAQLPSKLLYLGAAALLFSQMKKTQGA